MGRYFGRKLAIYALTFVVAVTINWLIPRFMPGDPVRAMVARAGLQDPAGVEAMREYYTKLFGFDLPWWQQYLNFWGELFSGNFGVSLWAYPKSVGSIILEAVPYTLGLLLPAILLSWWAGNKFGAYAARKKVLDNTVLPVWYVLTATPYMWLAILLAWALGKVAGIFPVGRSFSASLEPSFTWLFITDLISHWFLPFLSLFLVLVGGWAIGMRNLVIYELETDYANYLYALGAPNRLVRRYAFRNSLLPQQVPAAPVTIPSAGSAVRILASFDISASRP